VPAMNRSTPEKQTLILWALLVRENAAAFQNELKPEPGKADRDALKDAGLIIWERRGRRIWIEATEKGWAWAGENLGARLPANSPAAGQILQAWLTRLKTFMESRGFALADMLGPQGAAQTQAARERVAEPAPSTPLDYSAVRERVRRAYLEVTGGRLNSRALLSDIRQRLTDIDHAMLDDVLRRMHLEEGTTLSGLNNPQEVTPPIRNAGLNFKGEHMFALWITK
jgi:hypothetical protein